MIVGIEDVEHFESMVGKGFNVYNSEAGKGAAVFDVTPRYSHEESYEAVFNEFKKEAFTPVYRKTKKGFRIFVVPRKKAGREYGPKVHLALLIITAITTTWAGYTWWAERNVAQSIMFAAALMGILGIHELGHYFTARKREIEATLPFFIPAPPIFPLGTLGAVILMRSPVKNRSSLIDVGLAGPLVGFLVTIPVAIIGLKLSTVEPVSTIVEDEVVFIMPLILQILSGAIFGEALKAGTVIQPHSIAMAAWVGFLVTSLNILPMGQLDGGHVIRGLFPVHFRKIYRITALLLLIIGIIGILFGSLIWIFWVVLAWIMTRLDHPGPLNDVSEPDTKKKILSIAILVLLLVLCFTPAPVVPSELLSNL